MTRNDLENAEKKYNEAKKEYENLKKETSIEVEQRYKDIIQMLDELSQEGKEKIQELNSTEITENANERLIEYVSKIKKQTDQINKEVEKKTTKLKNAVRVGIDVICLVSVFMYFAVTILAFNALGGAYGLLVGLISVSSLFTICIVIHLNEIETKINKYLDLNK